MKKIILVITIGLFTISAFSQKQQNRHEFSIWGGGGISSLQYNLSVGEHKMGYGYIGGLGYNYFLNYNLSLGIGAEFSSLTATAKLPIDFEDVYRIGLYDKQDGSDAYYLKTDRWLQTYKENQQAYYINIPVMAKYQIDAFKGHKFYVAAGPKIGIPLDYSFYKPTGIVRMTGIAEGELHTADWFGVAGDGMKNRGWGTFNISDEMARYKRATFNLNVIAAIESGMKWKLNEGWSLYTGIYFDYGLVDIRKGDVKKNFLEYNQDDVGTFESYTPSSVLFSGYNTEGQAEKFVPKTAFAERVNTMALGLKVQLAYGTKPFDKKEKVKPIIEEKPYEGLTASQMEDIMNRNTNKLIDAQQKEFEALKALITKEDPDFADAIYGFEFDKSNILNVMHPDLNRKVELLKKYPEAKITLEGHTDDAGSDAYNYRLGLDRANAAKQYLAARGINPNRIEVTSKGRTEPKIPNADEASRTYNRRVEFLLRK